jgi:hypothetical protein
MKKLATRYLALFGILNLLLAQGTMGAANMWLVAYHKTGILIQTPTVIFLRFYWWPYLFCGFALLLVLASRRSQLSDNTFYHFIFGMLVAECFLLLISQAAFALPFTQIMSLN